jgi:hypothetical protein
MPSSLQLGSLASEPSLNRYALIMSTAEKWDFTVPDDDAELLAELRRHGVAPGRRLHVSVASDQAPEGGQQRRPPSHELRRLHPRRAGLVGADR